MTQGTLSFMSLPREIRDQIYHHYFERSNKSAVKTEPCVYFEERPPRSSNVRIHLELLYSARPIFSEALLIFCTKFPFNMSVRKAITGFPERNKKSFEGFWLTHTTKLRIIDVEGYHFLDLGGQARNQCQYQCYRYLSTGTAAFWETLHREFFDLKHLSINLGCWFDQTHHRPLLENDFTAAWLIRKCAIHCSQPSSNISFTFELAFQTQSWVNADIGIKTQDVMEGKNGFLALDSYAKLVIDPTFQRIWDPKFGANIPLFDIVKFPPNLRTLHIELTRVSKLSASIIENFHHGGHYVEEKKVCCQGPGFQHVIYQWVPTRQTEGADGSTS